jgi:hypothetical protein
MLATSTLARRRTLWQHLHNGREDYVMRWLLLLVSIAGFSFAYVAGTPETLGLALLVGFVGLARFSGSPPLASPPPRVRMPHY